MQQSKVVLELFLASPSSDRKVAYGVDYERSTAYATEKSRLHCEWRRSNPVVSGLHTILDARGRGHYVGSILQVESEPERGTKVAVEIPVRDSVAH